jgi:tRNA threonylcarbamoyladenosine biosynthesis protein TsaB
MTEVGGEAPPARAASGGRVTVLGIDTSTAATAVCVERADGARFEAVPDPARLLAPPAHTRELMSEVLGQMRAAEVGFADLDWVAVGVGPGAYTGLRIGLATARALGQAHGLPLRPVGSLAALAAGIGAPVALPLIDARRGELFAALHVGAEARWAPFVTGADALLERLESARRDGLESPLAAGDGSLRFRHVLEAASVEVAPAGSRRHVVRALHVCRLAASAPALPPEAVLPSYLRAPDATPR